MDDESDSELEWGASIHHLDHAPSGHSSMLSSTSHHHHHHAPELSTSAAAALRARAYSADGNDGPSSSAASKAAASSSFGSSGRSRLWSAGTSSSMTNNTNSAVLSSASFPPIAGGGSGATASEARHGPLMSSVAGSAGTTSTTVGSMAGNLLKSSIRGAAGRKDRSMSGYVGGSAGGLSGGKQRKSQTLFGGVSSVHSRTSFSQQSMDYITEVLSPHGGASMGGGGGGGDSLAHNTSQPPPKVNNNSSDTGSGMGGLVVPTPSPPPRVLSSSLPPSSAPHHRRNLAGDRASFFLHRRQQSGGGEEATTTDTPVASVGSAGGAGAATTIPGAAAAAAAGGNAASVLVSPQSSFYSETSVAGLDFGDGSEDLTQQGGGGGTRGNYDNPHLQHSASSVFSSERLPIIVCGIQLPSWCGRPSWHRVSTMVVTKAPCFWFCCGQHFQATDRAILQRLNILCAFLSLFQVAAALFLNVVTVVDGKWDRDVSDDKDLGQGSNTFVFLTNVWFVNGNILLVGVMAVVIFVAAVLTVPMIRNVNILGAVRYLWLTVWLVSFETLFVIGMFDYFSVTQVWIKHWWRDDTFGVFRQWYCNPTSTANTLCAPPVLENQTQVDAWCQRNYNSTECFGIRASAQDEMERIMLAFYYCNAALGLVIISTLLLVINTLESIISRPIVQKSRESNLAAWFALPFFGSLGIGLVYAFSNQSVLSPRSGGAQISSWIALLYIISAGLFLLAAFLGWFIGSYSILNARDKRYKHAAILFFILITATILFALVAIFAGSILFSTNLVGDKSGSYLLKDTARANIACFIDQSRTCTGCDERDLILQQGGTVCPQWSTADVTKILQTQAKASATLSAIFLMYAASALRFGFSMRRNIMLYQIDYV